MRFRPFNEIRRAVQEQPVAVSTSAPLAPMEDLCRAMDYACVLYLKPVLCLQRSAATTILLRRHGWSADMVIGAQILPFKSHAWCEVDGLVVNDKPYTRNIYEVLERC
jgi:hypothetical protein